MTKFQIRAGRSPALTWALSETLYETRAAAVAAAENWGGVRPFDGRVAVWVKRVPDPMAREMPRRPAPAAVAAPVLRKIVR